MSLPIDPKILMSQALSNPEGLKNKSKDPAVQKQVCQEFEALLVQSMFKSMRAAVPEGGLFESGIDREIFQDLMDQSIARDLSRNHGLGLAEILFKQLYGGEETPKEK